jgi:hypothetical protein
MNLEKYIILIDCKETNEYVNLVSNKINRLEELVNNFHKNFPKKNTRKFLYSIQNLL